MVGGGIGISIDMFSFLTIKIIDNEKDIIISNKEKMIKHFLDLMRKEFKVNLCFEVIYKQDSRIKVHSGMGSNASIQTGIAYGINLLLEYPFSTKELISIIQNNYCEEVKNSITNQIYCSGVAHNTIIYGGLCFIDDEGNLIYSKEFPESYKVGIVKASIDNLFMEPNQDNDEIVVNLRKKNNNDSFAYKKSCTIKKIIKDLEKDNFLSLIDGMKMFSENDDSRILSEKFMINNIKYDTFTEIIEKQSESIIRISSNSPYIYIITEDIIKVKDICEKLNINMEIYNINNSGIEIVERIG